MILIHENTILLKSQFVALFCDKDRETPLLMASRNGHQECVRLLLIANASTDLKNKVLLNIVVVVQLKDSFFIYSFIFDQSGDTALILAAQTGQLKCVELLLILHSLNHF